MYRVKIREVIWNDKKWNGGFGQKAIGIAQRQLEVDEDNFIEVEIMQKSRSGHRYHPYPFRILKSQVKTFGVDRKKGVKIYIVPLAAMQEIDN